MDTTPVIGVMGGADVPDEVGSQARQLGRRIGERGWVLLNGGRDEGVMRASAQGAASVDGVVLGILPDRTEDQGPPAEDLTYRIFTGLGEARNLINVLSSDVVVACRGGAGTLSEVAFGIKTRTPVVLLDWPPGEVPDQLDGPHLFEAASPRQAISQVDELLTEAGATP